jgi:uncharacterized membrane protein
LIYHIELIKFIQTPKKGTSALFILIRKATGDKVLDRLKEKGFKGKILQTSLEVDAEEELRKVIEG